MINDYVNIFLEPCRLKKLLPLFLHKDGDLTRNVDTDHYGLAFYMYKIQG